MLLPGSEGEVCFEDLVEKRKPQYCGDHDQPYSTAITIAKIDKKKSEEEKVTKQINRNVS